MATRPESEPLRGVDREKQVRRIFAEIAPRYDLVNHLLSLNIDRVWRRRAVGRLDWRRDPRGVYLDACAGTFDLSLELARRNGFEGVVVASDFSQPMLFHGLEKLDGAAILPVCGDTLRLPFPNDHFSGAMVAFGVRNLSDVDGGLAELHRVLRGGARLVILDFTLPSNAVARALYMFYFTRVLPLVGRIVSGHPWAYRYLPESVKDFPAPPELSGRLAGVGFAKVDREVLTGGIAALQVATKEAGPSTGPTG